MNRSTTFTFDGRTYDVCLWRASACQKRDMTLVIERFPGGRVQQFAIARHADMDAADRRYDRLCKTLAAGRLP